MGHYGNAWSLDHVCRWGCPRYHMEDLSKTFEKQFLEELIEIREEVASVRALAYERPRPIANETKRWFIIFGVLLSIISFAVTVIAIAGIQINRDVAYFINEFEIIED